MKRLLLVTLSILLILALQAPARAEEVFVGNRPFQGAVSGAGVEPYVDAGALARALGLEFRQAAGLWQAGSQAAPEGTRAGSVVFAGKVVPSRLDQAGRPLVHLRSAAEAVGAVMRVNRQMGSIDINKPVQRPVEQAARQTGGVEASGAAPGPRVLNKGNPGGTVDVTKNMVRGRINVVDFYADWCGPCRQLAPELEALAKKKGFVVLKVDIARWGSPVATQYGIRSVPHLVVYDKSGKKVVEGLQESWNYLNRL